MKHPAEPEIDALIEQYLQEALAPGIVSAVPGAADTPATETEMCVAGDEGFYRPEKTGVVP